METNYIDNELEQMRRQMDVLKEKLSNQEIVNNRLMREAMRHKMSWITKYVWAEVIAIPFLFLIYIILKDMFNWSWWLYAFIMIMIIIDVYCDIRVNRIRPNFWAECELIDMSRRLVRMNKMRLVQLAVGMVTVLIAFVWAWIDTELPQGYYSEIGRVCAISGCIGLVVGTILGVWVVWKMNKTNKQVIKEIDEITKSNK